MNKIHEWVNTVLIALVFILVLVGGNHQSVVTPDQGDLGAVNVGTRFPHGLTTGINGTSLNTDVNLSVYGAASISQSLKTGGILSTSTPANMTMAYTDLQYSVISVLPTVGSITMTLPASTTMSSSYLPNAGDSTQFVVHNASSTAGIKITLAGGTGSLVEVSTSTAATTFLIQPLGTALIEAYRKANTDYIFYGTVSQ